MRRVDQKTKNKDLENKAYEMVSKGQHLWRLGNLDGALENHIKAVDILRSRVEGLWTIDDSDVATDLGHLFRATGGATKGRFHATRLSLEVIYLLVMCFMKIFGTMIKHIFFILKY